MQPRGDEVVQLDRGRIPAHRLGKTSPQQKVGYLPCGVRGALPQILEHGLGDRRAGRVDGQQLKACLLLGTQPVQRAAHQDVNRTGRRVLGGAFQVVEHSRVVGKLCLESLGPLDENARLRFLGVRFVVVAEPPAAFVVVVELGGSQLQQQRPPKQRLGQITERPVELVAAGSATGQDLDGLIPGRLRRLSRRRRRARKPLGWWPGPRRWPGDWPAACPVALDPRRHRR